MPLTVPPDSYRAADGQDYTQGAVGDSAVVGDTAGTVSAKLRGLNKIFNSIWSSVNGWINIGPSSMDGTYIYIGGVACTPKWSIINASASGITTQIASVSGKKIRVIALVLTSNGTVNVKFQSSTTPTDKTGLFYEVANTGFSMPLNPYGWFETISGEALNINLSAAIAVGGILQYIEV